MKFGPCKDSVAIGIRGRILSEVGSFPEFALQGFFFLFGHLLVSSEFGPGKQTVAIGIRGWVFLKVEVFPILVTLGFFGNAFRNHRKELFPKPGQSFGKAWVQSQIVPFVIILRGVVEFLLAVLIAYVSPILEAHGIALQRRVIVLGPFVEGGEGIIGTLPFSLFRILKKLSLIHI